MDGSAKILRPVARLARGMPTSDGAGVKLNRLIGTPQLDHVDPFLMLDEFRSDDADDYIAGFPEHPHRGFETVTYMLAGKMRHGDNKGHTGRLDAGSVQWMTAGRGIVHSEMPEQENGLMWGFQLWVNLPAKDKMTAPRYQEIPPAEIPTASLSGRRLDQGDRGRSRRRARPDRRHRHRARHARHCAAGRGRGYLAAPRDSCCVPVPVSGRHRRRRVTRSCRAW